MTFDRLGNVESLSLGGSTESSWDFSSENCNIRNKATLLAHCCYDALIHCIWFQPKPYPMHWAPGHRYHTFSVVGLVRMGSVLLVNSY